MDSRRGTVVAYDLAKAQGVEVARTHEETGSDFPDMPAESPALATKPLNISIVSNSLLLRDGLLALLGIHIKVHMAGSYTGSPLPAAPAFSPPGHVVLLDAAIGDEAAVVWTRYWLGISPPPRVVVLELANNRDTILACIEAGASGYALQGASLEEVVGVIRQAQSNQAQCSPEITAALFARLASYSAAATQTNKATPPMRVPLSARELEVLHLIAQDYSNQEIAARLVIQVHTVKHHVHNLLEKLNLQHRWDAARLAQEQGWLDPNHRDENAKTQRTRRD